MASNAVDENVPWSTFFWNIDNYSYYWHDEKIQSPVFTVESKEKSIWNLIVHPRGKTEEHFISYYLRGSSSGAIGIEYDVAILAENDSILQLSEKGKKYRCLNTWSSEMVVLRKDVLQTKIEAFLSRDTLRFRCRLWRTDGAAVTPVTFFARTSARVEKREFLWKIAGFSSLKSGKKVSYVIKSSSNDELMVFNMMVIKNCIVNVRFKSLDEDVGFVKFQAFLIDAKGNQINCGKREMWSSKTNEILVCTLPYTEKNLMDEKDLFLKDDILTLHCKCAWCKGNDIHRIEKVIFGNISPCNTTPEIPYLSGIVKQGTIDLIKDLQCLYTGGILSDVKLRTTTQTFEAHKTILAARSPVFRAMFATDMKEKMQESVDVPDLEDDTVGRMLLYMYTNALKGLEWESALKLYAAADKYEVVALKSKCCSFLKGNLRPNNVCDVLILADMHADIELKATVQDYILKNEQEVYCLDEWKVFAKDNSSLAIETMLLKWNTDK